MLAALLKHGMNKKGTYDVLKNFKVAVPCDDGGSQVLHLGVWLHKQRGERLKGTLCPDKEALLQVCSALKTLSPSALSSHSPSHSPSPCHSFYCCIQHLLRYFLHFNLSFLSSSHILSSKMLGPGDSG